MDKRSVRGLEPLCRDCCMRPAKTITGAFGKCLPWNLDFDADDNPMLNGELYLPGERICQNRDCTNKEHVIER